MPFTVMFLPTDASPPPARIEADMRAIAAAEAGPVGPDGTVRPAGAAPFRFYNNDISLRRLSSPTCKVVFDVARRTNSYVFTGGRAGRYMMMSGSRGRLADDDSTPVIVPDAAALCVRLHQRLRQWDSDLARDQKAGILDANEQPIEPPPGPGTETRVKGDRSEVVARCDEMMGRTIKALGWKLKRRIVTQDPKWGLVWRADLAPEDDPRTWFRDTCWSRSGKASGVSISSRPLEMFDPKQSVPPLPAQ